MDFLLQNLFRFIEPTILLDPPLDAEIMTEEIFGPFLPIITVRKSIPTQLFFDMTFDSKKPLSCSFITFGAPCTAEKH